MRIQRKDFWKNYFKFRTASWDIRDFVALIMEKTGENNIPADVVYDRFYSGGILSKYEGDCAVIFNPDYPKDCARFCLIQSSTEYNRLIEGWKLYFASNTIPPTAKSRSTSLNDLSTALFGPNKSANMWSNIMEEIFVEMERELSK